MNLFAMLNNTENPIRRIPLSGELQNEVKQLFITQKTNFTLNKSKIEFNGDYKADSNEIFKISNFMVNDILKEAVKNPLSVDILNLKNETKKIKALFAGEWIENQKYILFQVFDSRKVLKKELTLLFSNNTYKKLTDPGLMIQDKLTTVFEESELLFYSYHNTKRIFDLSSYYIEATDNDLDDFVSNDLFYVSDKEAFKNNSDSVIRKKVALLQKNNVLSKVNATKILEAGEAYNIEIEINNDNKVVVPSDKHKLKELVKLLDEDYFTTPFTNRKCMTNSKRIIE